MSSSTDKRKGGTNHAQRPTAASTNRQVHPASSSMPAPPPRAAMGSANAAEASHEAAAAASMADRKEDEKDKEKEASPPSTTNTATSTTSTSSTPRHRDRERETASPAALRAQLRQKEERIAYLEKEMDIMEREFQKELDKLSQNESETATFWQAKHSALNQQYLRTDTELRLLRSEIELRQSEREELTQGWEMLRRELKERDEEIRGLKGQVRGLKEFVSTSTRTDGQASDEIFAEGMARLGNGLQNWVITNFRKAKINLAKADEATLAELNELVPMYEELAKTAKVHLLQSVVSRILVQMIFEAYFVGLSPEQTNQFRQMEDMLLKLAGGSDEPVNQWRAATLSLLKRDPEQLNFDTAGFAESIVARTNRVLGSVTDATGSEARDTALRVLVNNSIELARLMVVQKARLKVYMPEILPHQQVFFEADTMEDIGGEDEDSLEGREISCVVFPGVMKFGDENGQQMQFRNVICKARILCSQD